jgi:TonB-linked SusC/RagA family outer membrane protein
MNYHYKSVLESRLNVFPRWMLTLLLLMVWCIPMMAYGNVQKMDFSTGKANLELILKSLQRQTNYHFFYNDAMVRAHSAGPLQLQDVTLTQILDEVFRNTDLTYRIQEKQVIVKKAVNETSGIVPTNISVDVQQPIRGSVNSVQGEGLPGVTVVVVGTNRGVITATDGSFTIQAYVGESLSFSLIGMESQIIKITNENFLQVVLKESTSILQEVILVGYGKETKESLVGSVSVVKADDLHQVPLSTFEQSLRGSVAGLRASAMDGAPGANTQIRIRGIGSISASSEPLYVIDGVPVQSGDITMVNGNAGRSSNVMAQLNPNDIESISVLKDAAATAIYGSRGANGVILITTKSGQSEAPKVTFSSLVGFNSGAYKNSLKPLNAKQYTQLFLEGYINKGDTYEQAQTKLVAAFPQMINPQTGDTTNTNWLDAISRVGVTQSYNLSASGGTDKLTYYFSGAYYDQESYIIGSDFQRLNARANMEYKLSEHVRVSNNLYVSKSLQHTFPDAGSWENPIKNAIELPPLIPIYDDQGRYNADHGTYFGIDGVNPVGALSGDNLREINQLRITDNVAVAVDFLNDFTFRTQWNYDLISLNEFMYENPRYGNGKAVGGTATNANTVQTNWVGTNTLSYTKKLNTVHQVNGMIGYEAQESKREMFSATGNGFPNAKLRTLNSTSTGYTVRGSNTGYSFLAMFAKADYNYNQRYFFSSSIRRDGSSRFGASNRWGTFYSVGGGWVASNESFLANVSQVQFLRLRTSYGLTGNAAIGDFSYAGLYTYGRDYNGVAGGIPDQIGNPNLTWETQKNFNAGIDFEIFGRLSGTVEYFIRKSSDLILDVPISLTTGFPSLTQNYGEMGNTGIEISLNSDIIRTPDFSWNVGLNVTFIRNKITKLSSDFVSDMFARYEGQDFQTFYLYNWAGVDPANGNPQWWKDETKQEVVNNPSQAKRFVDGKSASPDHFGGFNTTLGYKGFTLHADFMYSYGNYIVDARARGLLSDGRLTPRSTALIAYETRWVPGKTDALWPQHKWGGQNGSTEQYNSRWLYDGSFLRLKNVTLAYQLPTVTAQQLKLKSLRVYVRGTNMLTFVKEKNLYMDPEQSIDGISDAMTPATKTFSIGLDLGL